MKSRVEAVWLVQSQLGINHECTRKKGNAFHYGKQELRELLDFIYESEPKSMDEMLGDDDSRRSRLTC